MKKLLFVGIMFFAFTAKAQEMNFEETVKYIQTKLKEFGECCYENNYDLEFKAKQNGDLEFGKIKINLFNLNNKGKKSWVDEYGMSITPTGLYRPLIDFWGGDANIYYILFKKTTSESDLNRFRKALIHLRSLCAKEKDPFD